MARGVLVLAMARDVLHLERTASAIAAAVLATIGMTTIASTEATAAIAAMATVLLHAETTALDKKTATMEEDRDMETVPPTPQIVQVMVKGAATTTMDIQGGHLRTVRTAREDSM